MSEELSSAKKSDMGTMLSEFICMFLHLPDSPALRTGFSKVFSVFMHSKTGEFEFGRFMDAYGLNSHKDFDPVVCESVLRVLLRYAREECDLDYVCSSLTSFGLGGCVISPNGELVLPEPDEMSVVEVDPDHVTEGGPAPTEASGPLADASGPMATDTVSDPEPVEESKSMVGTLADASPPEDLATDPAFDEPTI